VRALFVQMQPDEPAALAFERVALLAARVFG